MKKILIALNVLMISIGLNAQSDFSPSISPDGKKIAFYRYVEKVPQIFIMNADGNDLRQLTEDDQFWSIGPIWSKDMSKIYFSYGEGMASLDVSTIDLVSHEITRIKKEGMQFGLGEFGKSFLWASKGKSMEFYTSTDSKLENQELIVIDGVYNYWVYGELDKAFVIVNDEGKEGLYKKDNNRMNQLIQMKGIKNFSVSGNRKKLIFESSMNGTSDIYIGDINGENVKNMTSSKSTDYMPSISPNSDFIVFSSNRHGGFCLFKLFLETNELIQLTGKDN